MVLGLPRPFSKKKTALTLRFFLLDYAYLFNFRDYTSRTYSTFLYFSFAQWCKILSKFSKLSTTLKHRGKIFVMMTSIVHLSSNTS